MAALMMTALPFVAFLGLLALAGAGLVAYFWPQVEGWLIHTLQERRRKREVGPGPRLGVRRPR